MDNEQLTKIRHTLAHLLAAAVLKDYPHAKLTLGPAIDNGFYYDIDFKVGEAPGDDDLKNIQKNMKKMLSSWKAFSHKEVTAEEARKVFEGNEYKTELIDELEKKGETITLYSVGEGKNEFTDLCRGGHAENPAQEISSDSFKLDKIAGAYWRGDENNPMLTRIYGLAFESKEKLDEHLTMLEEAKKRDHRKLGVDLDLFVLSDLVGSGLPLFTPKGTILRDELNDFLWELNKKHGYQKVDIPHIAKPDLYKVSGHWEKYKEDGFQVHGRDKHFMLKPMNCPHHTQIYSSRSRSYRDLPFRYFETTKVYRDEQSGELMGLSRVLSITQDDGHVFCRPDQIGEEVAKIVSIIKDFYTAVGMMNDDTYTVFLSVRDPEKPEDYLGDVKIWDMAEKQLEDIGNEHGLSLKREEGEAAFYGPKLDFMFKDAIGREWQLATIQLDFVQPDRFQLEYTDENGEKKQPVMIHRAISGSIERFLSVMIEHYAGAFPLWLAPEQVRILPIADAHKEHAQTVHETLKNAGIRAELDGDAETLGKKIRRCKIDKVPYFLVIGDEEVKNATAMVESRTKGQEGALTMDELVEKFTTEIKNKVS